LTTLSKEKVAELQAIVAAKLEQISKPDAWPITMLTTIVPMDVDDYDAVTGRSATAWSSSDSGGISVATRRLHVEHVALSDVRHTRTLTEVEATGSQRNPPDAKALLEVLATTARMRQLSDLVGCLAPYVPPVKLLDTATLKNVLDDPRYRATRALVTVGPILASLEESIADIDVIHSRNDELRDVPLVVGGTVYRLAGVLASARDKPVVLYRASDIGVTVTPDQHGGATVELLERRAYVRVPERPVFLFGRPVLEDAGD
jgi:hypothetical protein